MEALTGTPLEATAVPVSDPGVLVEIVTQPIRPHVGPGDFHALARHRCQRLLIRFGWEHMDIEANIKSLERRHQELARDFKAGKIDEATFTAEVDRLQFQDSWGRYWMLGAQSGMWHYYDGQAWQQADPRQADRLPFMDDQGTRARSSIGRNGFTT